MKLKKEALLIRIGIFITLTSFIGLLFFAFLYYKSLNDKNRITSLPIPTIKELPQINGQNLLISGAGNPDAKVYIYVNNSYYSQTDVNDSGYYSKSIELKVEGEAVIKVRQVIGEIQSEFSSEQKVIADLTAPNPKSFKLDTKLPSLTNKKSILLVGKMASQDELLIGSEKVIPETDGTFKYTYNLIEGKNTLLFKLSDRYNNITEVIYSKIVECDTKPPNINMTMSLYNRESSSRVNTIENINVRIDTWTGYLDSYNSVPITGSVSEGIKFVSIDGKEIKWDENREIYQRLTLFIRGGLNKYKVVVKDIAGNQSTGYVETTAQKDNETIDINLNKY